MASRPHFDAGGRVKIERVTVEVGVEATIQLTFRDKSECDEFADAMRGINNKDFHNLFQWLHMIKEHLPEKSIKE